jgi:TRAP-type mannitol/chloroaromatic compound transport system permease small subunit
VQVLLSYVRLVDWISDKLGKVAAYMIMLSCLISAGNAIIRYAFDKSSNGWLEIQWYLFGAAVMLAASHVLKMNEHVRVDVIYGRFKSRGQVWIDIFGLVFFLLSMSVISAYLAWPFFYEKFKTMEMSSNSGGLVRWPIALMLPVGFGLLTLQGIAEIIKRVGWLNGTYNMDVHYEKPLQ